MRGPGLTPCRCASSSSGRSMFARSARTTITLSTWYRSCRPAKRRSEEHTSELQSQSNLVCRLLLEKKKETRYIYVQLTTRGHEFRRYPDIPPCRAHAGGQVR